jgi:hypothetical protein
LKTYPTIRYFQPSDIGKSITAFQKLDGSNIRAEWNRKRNFYKFGSRNHLISESDVPLGEAVRLIREQEEELNKILLSTKMESAVCFFEFWGENSRFGQHQKELHHCTLIDISLFKKGYLVPGEFIELFSKTAPVLYQGLLSESFVQSVKDGTLEGLGSEGVVCKGALDKKTGQPFMVKLKRQSWFDELRKFCGGDEKKFKELA